MGVKINVSKARRRVLPAGERVLNIDVCKWDKAKSSGEKKVHLELLVDGVQHPDFEDVRLYLDISAGEKSKYRLLELAEAVYGTVAEDEDGNFDFSPKDYIGGQVSGYVSVSTEFDGTPRNKIGVLRHPSKFGEPYETYEEDDDDLYEKADEADEDEDEDNDDSDLNSNSGDETSSKDRKKDVKEKS